MKIIETLLFYIMLVVFAFVLVYAGCTEVYINKFIIGG